MRGTTIKLYPIQIGWFTSPCKPKLAVQIFSRKKCNNNKQKKGQGKASFFPSTVFAWSGKGSGINILVTRRTPSGSIGSQLSCLTPLRLKVCCRTGWEDAQFVIAAVTTRYSPPLKNYPETFHPIFCAAFTAQQLLHSRVALNVIKRPRYLERWYSWNKSASYLSSRCLRYLKRGNWRTNWLVSCELVIKSSGAVTRSNFVQSFDETLAEVDDRVCWGECSLMLHRILVGEPTVENDNK